LEARKLEGWEAKKLGGLEARRPGGYKARRLERLLYLDTDKHR
jgi:hypothetical protein